MHSTASATTTSPHFHSPAQTAPPRSSNHRLLYLLDLLDSIRHTQCALEMESTMTNFTSELLQIHNHHKLNPQPSLVFHKGDETMLLDLQSHGAISILLHAMHRSLGTASPNFFNSATIALVHLVFRSPTRTKMLLQLGGVGTLVEMMHVYRQVDYVQMIGIAALMVLGKNSGNFEGSLEDLILHQIVLAMETHPQSPKVYTVACSALGNLFGPDNCALRPNSQGINALFHRSLEAITHGLVLHPDDPMAQGVGNALLYNIVGPEAAHEMILSMETAYSDFACAAAA